MGYHRYSPKGTHSNVWRSTHPGGGLKTDVHRTFPHNGAFLRPRILCRTINCSVLKGVHVGLFCKVESRCNQWQGCESARLPLFSRRPTSSSNLLESILVVGNGGICHGTRRQSVRSSWKSLPSSDSVRGVRAADKIHAIRLSTLEPLITKRVNKSSLSGSDCVKIKSVSSKEQKEQHAMV